MAWIMEYLVRTRGFWQVESKSWTSDPQIMSVMFAMLQPMLQLNMKVAKLMSVSLGKSLP
jgi:hypothetical protein